MTNPRTIKGRGFTARHVTEISPGLWSIPMYRNRDDCEMGCFEIRASTAHRAFNQALQECRQEMRR